MSGKRPARDREDRRCEDGAGDDEPTPSMDTVERPAGGNRDATARAHPRMEHVRPPATADEGARDATEEDGMRRLVKPEPEARPDTDQDGNGRPGAENERELEGEHRRDPADEARAGEHGYEGADERPTDGFGVERTPP